MHNRTAGAVLFVATLVLSSCSGSEPAGPQANGADPAITAFIAKIRAVDNHTHANSTAPGDSDADALPLDGIAPFEIPATLRPDNPAWLAAYQALLRLPDEITQRIMCLKKRPGQ